MPENDSALNRIVESTWARGLTRLIAPILLIMLTVIGWLVTTGYGEVQKSINDVKVDMSSFRDKFWSTQAQIVKDQNSLGTALQILNAKVDTNRQLSEENDRRLQRDLDDVKHIVQSNGSGSRNGP